MLGFRLNIEALLYAQDAPLRPALLKPWTCKDNNFSHTNADD